MTRRIWVLALAWTFAVAALVLHTAQLARSLASGELQVAELLTLGEDETT